MADDMAGLHKELSSSKLVLLDVRPFRPSPGRERLLEVHLAVAVRLPSAMRPRKDIWPSDGVLLSTLGERISESASQRGESGNGKNLDLHIERLTKAGDIEVESTA